MSNPFVWTDLSTFDTVAARSFYEGLFGWRFSETTGTDGAPYFVASHWFTSVSALFEMPERLQALNLPSFWMSYIRVDDVSATVAKAKAVEGTIIEVPATDAGDGARIALIRDPSGAGFTVYEGPEIDARKPAAGRHMWNVHHSGDVAAIKPFYRDVFGWSIEAQGDGVYEIRDADGQVIAHAEEAADAVRGKFRYWMPIFGVRDVDASVARAEELGGSCIARLSEDRAIVADTQGAALLLQSV